MYKGEIIVFCKNCGTEMSDTAKFCPKCGTEREGVQEAKKEVVEDNKIKFQVKPKFNIPYKMLTIVGRAILYMIIICCWLTDLYELWALYPITFLITIGIMALYIIIKLAFEKMQYDDLEYNFYTTKVEYKDGFLNKEEKELKYKYVREVTMNQNIFERLFNIGTIKIFTNASSGGYPTRRHNNMQGKNGIYIHCVENVKEQYETIKGIIDEGTPEE